MDDALPLPRSTADLVLKRTRVEERHPGLQLDKYLTSIGSQEAQKRSLLDVCRAARDQDLLAMLFDRRKRVLQVLSAVEWPCTTAGPLTLHLARASALENAGICLHPVYGFVFLPGSGLKGMARAFAETHWLPAQSDEDAACSRILEVFGRAPDSAGAVVFHDAWPDRWPQLGLDIVNNHHKAYYEGKDDPGDWEDPTMVSFLAIGAGEAFSFALSKRRPDVADELVTLAREWLTGALVHLGAGAKTAAGYGGFRPTSGEVSALPSAAVRAFETTLELVTPAFLAGATQTQEDCELRPATLRGLLRWWWRTMHAGFVDRARLRAMEAAVWGDTEAGSPVRVTVDSVGPAEPRPYAFKDHSEPKSDFAGGNELQRPGAPRTTQGLFYISYGMDEKGKRRHFRQPGTKWIVRLTARRGYRPATAARAPRWQPPELDAGLVLSQATAALWLLCRFGGVGSKARKGFGSFADVAIEGIASLDDCRIIGRRFREACGLGDPPFEPGLVESPSLGVALGPVEIDTPWTNYWFALDQVGAATQDFAKRYKHDEKKRALGLPRRIGRPPAARPLEAVDRKGSRHASPVLYHVTRVPSGRLAVRVVAFPAKYLPPMGDRPDMEANARFLRELQDHLERDLDRRVKQYEDKGRRPPYESGDRPAGAAGPQTPPVPPVVTPKPGDLVPAVLLHQRTKKGGWRAKHEPSDRSGEIQNSAEVPADKKAGEVVTLLVHSVPPKGIVFRWPSPGEVERGGRPRQGGPAGRPRPGGRGPRR